MNVVIKYDADSGRIIRWRPAAAPDLNPDTPGIERDVDEPGETLDHKYVDTSVDPPELVDDPSNPTETDALDERVSQAESKLGTLFQSAPVRRGKASDASKQAFRDARDGGDVQTQLDILFEIVTGEAP